MRITPRDIQLLYWINAVGYVNVSQIATRMGASEKAAYRRCKLLVDHGYLKHNPYIFHQKGIYRITKQAALLCGTPLPVVKMVCLGSYDHHIQVTDFSLALAKKHDCDYIPNRLNRHLNDCTGVGISGHHVDSVLHLDDKTIAIDFEFNLHSKKARASVMASLMRQFDYDEIWYICGNTTIQKQAQAYQKSMPFLKVILLDELMKRDNTTT